MDTVKLWRSDWGDAYHQRNRFQPDDVRPVFDRILKGIHLNSVLEVGSGLGHNIQAIQAQRRVGVEPNRAARHEARAAYPDSTFLNATADYLPFPDNDFDLVLTCGLLIHIPTSQIRDVVVELCRVTRQYLLMIEYAACEEEAVTYRGVEDALWRRPFGKLAMCWGGMKLVAWDDEPMDLYPGCCWWLMEKGEG